MTKEQVLHWTKYCNRVYGEPWLAFTVNGDDWYDMPESAFFRHFGAYALDDFVEVIRFAQAYNGLDNTWVTTRQTLVDSKISKSDAMEVKSLIDGIEGVKLPEEP